MELLFYICGFIGAYFIGEYIGSKNAIEDMYQKSKERMLQVDQMFDDATKQRTHAMEMQSAFRKMLSEKLEVKVVVKDKNDVVVDFLDIL